MLIGMFTHQHLSAVSTLRTSSAQLQLLHLTAARIKVYASRLVTLVRTSCSLSVFLTRTFCLVDCQDASDILIYGQLVEIDHSYPTSSTSSDSLSVLQLRAARIITQPPVQQPRPPRPDDPVPRFPPAVLHTKRRRVEESPSTRLKRRKEEAVLQNARNVMTRMPSADVIRIADRPKMLSQAKTLPDDVFRVPPTPVPKGKGKALDIAKELEKANKAVSRPLFLSFPTHLSRPGYA